MLKWIKEITSGEQYKVSGWKEYITESVNGGEWVSENEISDMHGYFNFKVRIKSKYINADIEKNIRNIDYLTLDRKWERQITIKNIREVYMYSNEQRIIYSIGLIPEIYSLNLLDDGGKVIDFVDIGYKNKEVIVNTIMKELGRGVEYMNSYNEWLKLLGEKINIKIQKIRYEYE